jgi:hypothetical protein
MVKELTGAEVLLTTPNGSWPLRRGSATFFVNVLEPSSPSPPAPPIVKVFSLVLTNVPKSAALLEELNQMNLQWNFVRAAWADGQVILSTELLAETLDLEELEVAISAVGRIADTSDEQLRARFGGQIPKLRPLGLTAGLSQRGLEEVLRKQSEQGKQLLRTAEIVAAPWSPGSYTPRV